MVEDIWQGDVPGVQLRCRQQLAGPVEDVWPWLTTTERLERWLAHRVQADVGVQGALLLESVDEAGTALREEATTLELEAPHRWVLALQQTEPRWPVATRLTLELSPMEPGCELSVYQTGFAHLPLSDCLTIWESYRRRWRRALDRLAEAIAET